MRWISLLGLFLILGYTGISQDFSGLKIMVNPGHGGHDSDDRFIPATGFWESESNLTKGLYLRDILKKAGATVVMSRVTNTTGDDLPLSQISQMANEADVDFFLSIHSNANDQRSNYPLMLYRGYDAAPVFPKAKEMAVILWNYLQASNRGTWTGEGPNVRGDWNFYPWGTQGLGVLRNLNMPGVLSEGSHHDYIMECWRLQNISYRRTEAWSFAWAFREYFNREPYLRNISEFSHGIVAGIVRDSLKENPWYGIPNSNDVFTPLNKVKVRLQPGNRLYQCDSMNNGYFAFDSVVPGSYTLHFSLQEYFSDSVQIEVYPNKISFADKFLAFDTTVVPKILSWSPAPVPGDSVASMTPVIIVFSHSMDTASVQKAFHIAPFVPGKFQWKEHNTRMEYVPAKPYEPAAAYSVMMSTEACQKWKVPIQNSLSFSFTSKTRNRYRIMDHFPRSFQENVSTQLQFRIVLDAPPDQASFIEAVQLSEKEGKKLGIKNNRLFTIGQRGYYTFDPETILQPETPYTLTLKATIADTDGNILADSFHLEFTTGKEITSQGVLLEGFESTGFWLDPESSPETRHTDPSKTYFLLYNKYIIEGQKSGRLDYYFSEKDGICYLAGKSGIEISQEVDSLGLWLFGDLSYNEFLLRIKNGNDTLQILLDTLNFSGWKFYSVPISRKGQPLSLLGFIIRTTEHSLLQGTLYLDKLSAFLHQPSTQTDQTTNFRFSLYPNPIHPNTLLRYEGENPFTGTIRIYDFSGRKLYEEYISLHSSQATWYPERNFWTSLPAGLYFIHCTPNLPEISSWKMNFVKY